MTKNVKIGMGVVAALVVVAVAVLAVNPNFGQGMLKKELSPKQPTSASSAVTKKINYCKDNNGVTVFAANDEIVLPEKLYKTFDDFSTTVGQGRLPKCNYQVYLGYFEGSENLSSADIHYSSSDQIDIDINEDNIIFVKVLKDGTTLSSVINRNGNHYSTAITADYTGGLKGHAYRVEAPAVRVTIR